MNRSYISSPPCHLHGGSGTALLSCIRQLSYFQEIVGQLRSFEKTSAAKAPVPVDCSALLMVVVTMMMIVMMVENPHTDEFLSLPFNWHMKMFIND
jgi:hypothetical protein